MIKAVVWDIGGVLLTDPKIGEFWQNKEGAKELRKEFGLGKLPVQDFVVKGSKLLNLNQNKFLESYKRAYFSIEPIKDTSQIYENMKADKYILSDTNPIHLDFVKKNFPKIFEMSKKNYFFSEIGLRKDSKEVFEFVLEDIGLDSKEILLIDNKREIADLSKNTGWNAIQFVNAEQLKQDLKRYNVK